MDKERLREFLIKANKAGYASEGAETKKESDGSHTMVYVRGDWRFHDNFFGGEPYGGREVIFYKGKPVWVMVYYGRIKDAALDPDDVYTFLRKCLRATPEDKPFRGPASLADSDWSYNNFVEGDIEHFHGNESISKGGKKVYEAGYIGGLVDVRNED